MLTLKLTQRIRCHIIALIYSEVIGPVSYWAYFFNSFMDFRKNYF